MAKDDKKKRRKTTTPPALPPEFAVLQASLERERQERASEADTMAKMLQRMGELEAQLRSAEARGKATPSASEAAEKTGNGGETAATAAKVEREITALLARFTELEEKSASTSTELAQLRQKQETQGAQPRPQPSAPGLAEELQRALLRTQGLERHVDQQQREIVGLKIDLEEARMRLKRAEESGPKLPEQVPEPTDSTPTLQETELSETDEQLAMLTGFVADLGETVADFLRREEQYFAFRKAVLEDIQLAVLERLGPQHEPAAPAPLPDISAPVRRLSSAAIDISQIAEMLESMRPPALGGIGGGRLSREMRAVRNSMEMAAVVRGDDPQQSARILLGPGASEAGPRSKSEAPRAQTRPSQVPGRADARASQSPAAPSRPPSKAPSRAPSRAPEALRASERPKQND